MKFFAFFGIVMLFVAGLFAAGLRAEGQGLDFSVTNSASSLEVSNELTYTIDITNVSGTSLPEVLVTNSVPSSVQFVSATTDFGSFTNYGTNVVFTMFTFYSGAIAQFTLTVEPTVTGLITNAVTVSSIYLPTLPNSFTTNVVVDVTNVVTDADLGVSLTGPNQPVITNDWMTYGIKVTNAGPTVAPNVILTNTLPPGVIVESIVPASQTYTTVGSNLLFGLGTMTNGGYTNLQLTVQVSTNAGVQPFSATVGSMSVADPNPSNNVATTNITVLDYLPGLLVVVTNSAQVINPQDGLEEQSILVSNLGTNDVPAARVVVTDLPKKLYNAVGTNGGNPFVTLGAPLAVGASVDLLLQYNPRGSFPFTNNQLQAYAVPSPNLTPPSVTGTTATINLNGIFKLPDGNVLIEFPATTGQTYTVVYSDNVRFSNAMVAPPAIVAPANEVQWIDYGPPTTVSAPTTGNSRFYRVLKNP